MKSHIGFRYAALIAMLGLCAASVAMAETDYEKLKPFADKIKTKMPNTWKVVQEKTGVIPYGHYDGLKYEGPRGLLIVLEGNRDVFLHWEDESGAWHRESLAKESLELWIMPAEYHQSWKRFFIMKSPVPAERIYSGRKAKVYGYPAHHITSLQKFEEKVSSLSAVTTSWPDSPYHKGILSWTTWKEDIKKSMQEAER